ncbi:MAG: tRNA (adenine(22)-N(1))-methyltransferase TrmK [Clostridia bacterium]|nr:tRNA (adenine(22)-N(1))-methyltransferase TrmK [Clostridia bacterium]
MPIRIDERLTAIATLVKGGAVADVGCDHGKLGYYLVSTDRAERVIATDISAPSLQKAQELAFDNGVSHLMETRLGDGLSPIKSNEVGTVVIAGLGGDVMAEILSSARLDGKEYEHFILSPNTHPEKVRRELAHSNHTIVTDNLTECAGKYYTIISTELNKDYKEALDEDQILYGKFFTKDKAFLKRTREEIATMKGILEAHKSAQLEEKIAHLEKILEKVEL